MNQLILSGVPDELLDKLEADAKRIGTTVELVALFLLLGHYQEYRRAVEAVKGKQDGKRTLGEAATDLR